MKTRRQPFLPTVADQLERREYLSSLPAFGRPVPVHREALIRHLSGYREVVPTTYRTTPVGRVERAFDSFSEDYRQARALFIGALDDASTSNAAQQTLSAFETYTVQRVNLLAEDLIGELQGATLQSGGKKGDSGAGARGFVTGKINRLLPANPMSTTPISRVVAARGTLLRGLLDPLRVNPLNDATADLNPINAEGEAATLIILAQDSAIEASRSAILNGVQAYRRLFSAK